MIGRSLGAIVVLLLLGGCTHRASQSFVSLKNGAFTLDGQPFFPLGVNYVMQLQCIDSACWAAPCRNYERGDTFRYKTRDSTLMQIKAEFRLMRSTGFNSVRLAGLASDLKAKEGSNGIFMNSQYGRGGDSLYALSGVRLTRYLDAVAAVVGLAKEEGLKLVILVRLRPEHPEWEEFFKRLAGRFGDDPTVMAYDFFNEPLYFDIHDRPKTDVYELVKHWHWLMKAEAPHQLSTIGLVGVPEVFAWDPNILAVDFISFHPYEYQREQVRNEMRWYGQYVDKPWIIGETAIPADNDSVPYADQLAFARKTLEQARACGAVGYTWWQFKDVGWGTFHADYMGVMSRAGDTRVDDALPQVQGTVKPVAQAFREFDPNAPRGQCAQLPNYYNFSSLTSARLTGRLLDEQGKPIEGGVVTGWNAGWTSSYFTITKSDGSFALYSNFPFHHWMASATRYSMVRGDVRPNTYITDTSGTPTFYLGELRVERLSFADPKP